MTKVAIIPENIENGLHFRAIAGSQQAVGRTAGEALDALTPLLPSEETGTLIVVQNFRPDRLFTAGQQERLRELMQRWRQAREQGAALSAEEQAELNVLVEKELQAAIKRAAVIVDESQP